MRLYNWGGTSLQIPGGGGVGGSDPPCNVVNIPGRLSSLLDILELEEHDILRLYALAKLNQIPLAINNAKNASYEISANRDQS